MEGLGILTERNFEDDFVAIDFARMLKTETKVERLRAPWAWNVRQLEPLEQAFASHMLYDMKQCNLPDASTLELGVDHEAPHAHFRSVGLRRAQRFVLEHDEADWLFAEIDRAIPSLWREQRLRQ
ncbi:hypothetical protein ASC87_26045 [Rhizobacter sp. Root1221]|nr:hypothetical protein ASC87_26045 [Rhizobacter sp. Root1221]